MLEHSETVLSGWLWRHRHGAQDNVVALRTALAALRDELAAIYTGLPGQAADVERAAAIAAVVHEGQTDKAGERYLGHPRRVAGRTDGSPEQVAAAWLHDVLEDGPFNDAEFQYGMEVLAREVSPRVAVAVHLLTKYPADKADDLLQYYCRIRRNPLALAVKLADIADNTDPVRLAQLPQDVRVRLEGKYARARAILGGDPGGPCTEPGGTDVAAPPAA